MIEAMKRRRIRSAEEEEEENEESMEKSTSEVAQAVETGHKSVCTVDRLLDLSPDILELIMKRFSYIDLINFGSVCKSWNSFNRGKNQTPLVHEYPWLVIFDETAISTLPSLVNRTSCSCQLFDPTYKKLYTIDMSQVCNFRIKKVYYSKYGWLLIMAKKYVLFAFTPFSSVNNFIQLPIFDVSKRRKGIPFATFTSNPSMDQDCLFIVIHNHHQYSSMFQISTCRRGDELWSTRTLKYSSPVVNIDREVGHWIYSEGNIYYMVLPKRPPYIGTPRGRKEYYEGLCSRMEYYEGLFRGVLVNPQNEKLLEPNKIVKWPVVVKRHGTDSGSSLYYGSFMKLDDEDHDDSKYWVSKLRKEFSDLFYLCSYTSDCDYGKWHNLQGQRKILKIDLPPHQ